MSFFEQHFLSELYVFLVDEMHKGLNQTLQIEDQAPIPKALTDSAQLKHFAREAEVNGNFPLAAKYYQDVSQAQTTCLLPTMEKWHYHLPGTLEFHAIKQIEVYS